jgi:hypothetical protein
MKTAILLILLTYYALHQDFWNWTTARPLIFGFLPVGLLYHALYAAGSSLLMLFLVRLAWPERLEAWAMKEPEA